MRHSTRVNGFCLIILLLALVGSMLGGISPIHAATIVVNSLSDDPAKCKQAQTMCLRNALQLPGTGGPNQITFSVTGKITLQTGRLVISRDVQVEGPGADKLSIDGDPKMDTVIEIKAGQVSIDDVTIEKGAAPPKATSASGGGVFVDKDASATFSHVVITGNQTNSQGGGIESQGTVTVSDATISNNSSIQGGGIFNLFGVVTVTNVVISGNTGGLKSSGTATVTNSTIVNNTGDQFSAGGIDNSGTMTITNSAIVNNKTTEPKFPKGSIDNEMGTLAISNSTISGNAGGGVQFENGNLTISNSSIVGNQNIYFGGGLSNVRAWLSFNGKTTLVPGTAANVTLLSDLIAGNTLSGAGSIAPDIAGPVTSLGYNLIGDDGGTSGLMDGTNHDHVGGISSLTALVGSLADNGGSTQTMALPAGSAAIGAGLCAGNAGVKPPVPAATTDQRGATRKTPCDTGAYESGATVPTVTATLVARVTPLPTFTPTPTPAAPNVPTSSPDSNGRLIIVANLNDVVMVNPDGTNPTPIDLTGGSASVAIEQPDWLVNASVSKLVFVEQKGNAYMVCTKDLLLNTPVFCPDSTFFKDSRGNPQMTSPHWSPDGRLILLSASLNRETNLYVEAPDGRNPQRIGPADQSGYSGAYSPDGKEIAFIEDQGAIQGIFIENSDGSNLHRLTTDLAAGKLSWSPDGQTIVFTAFTNDSKYILRKVSVQSGNVSNLNPFATAGTIPSLMNNPSWSPDGKQILFTASAGGSFNIYRTDPDGSNTVKVASGRVAVWGATAP